ncbi:hypothetical protein NUW58_g10727 [Xylaria curta]|uniref:Uncharacterized protein n=1 Tax=Xylaria curta TaxID=42375 RepID=A0ACC1MHA4_9PEZI|nr:hypothetical protein NUW58_g10727 [Xylaria curta]
MTLVFYYSSQPSIHPGTQLRHPQLALSHSNHQSRACECAIRRRAERIASHHMAHASTTAAARSHRAFNRQPPAGAFGASASRPMTEPDWLRQVWFAGRAWNLNLCPSFFPAPPSTCCDDLRCAVGGRGCGGESYDPPTPHATDLQTRHLVAGSSTTRAQMLLLWNRGAHGD